MQCPFAVGEIVRFEPDLGDLTDSQHLALASGCRLFGLVVGELRQVQAICEGALVFEEGDECVAWRHFVRVEAGDAYYVQDGVKFFPRL